MNIDTTAVRRQRTRRLAPRTRKLVLVIHVAVSVGWLGIAAVMIVLGVSLRATDDPDVLRGGYHVMAIIDNAVIIPAALLALVTGVLSGLGTNWGVLKHYWVLAKLGLVLLVIANGYFFLHEWTSQAAAGTGEPGFDAARGLLISGNLISLVLLAAATVLSIYKPWGKTPRGRRDATRRQRVRQAHAGRTP